MKKLKCYVAVIPIVLLCWGCNKKVTENYSVICSNETLILNSVNKTTFANGINRNTFTTKIPHSTRFLVVRVQVDNSDTKNRIDSSVDLLNSITSSTLKSELKLAGGIAVLAMMPPVTGKYCDFFIFPDNKNLEGFMEKGTVTNWTGTWESLPDPYRKLNTQSFNLVVDVNDLPDKQNIYLGFMNHNLTNACKVFIDIIAIR
ncbi:hypothetical protein CYCD_24690 [Tenuifilaceae bacterium CYCD]|nr:hypothetical protein CYCD_24690 [Tenuifilaceae bacterium CYCD]